MTPKVSVILPVHNRADVLPRAIESVLGQELREFELVVIDDGSTDGSAEVAGSFGDERIRLIRLDRNRGGNVARNEGIRAARAPLIAFLDSDDRYFPDKLAWTAAEFWCGSRGRQACRRDPLTLSVLRFRRSAEFRQQPRSTAVGRYRACDCLDISWSDRRGLPPEHEWRGWRLGRQCGGESCDQQLH